MFPSPARPGVPASARALAMGLLGLGAAAALMPALAAGAAPAPRAVADTARTSTQLLARFYGALVADDVVRLGALLAPQWMIQRANGTSATRARYVAAPPDVRQYQVRDIRARYSPPTLVVRYRAATQEPSATGALVTSPLAPRLATFTWMDGRWRMTSLANFNPPG